MSEEQLEQLRELLGEVEMMVRLATEESAPNRELAFFAYRLRLILLSDDIVCDRCDGRCRNLHLMPDGSWKGEPCP